MTQVALPRLPTRLSLVLPDAAFELQQQLKPSDTLSFHASTIEDTGLLITMRKQEDLHTCLEIQTNNEGSVLQLADNQWMCNVKDITSEVFLISPQEQSDAEQDSKHVVEVSPQSTLLQMLQQPPETAPQTPEHNAIKSEKDPDGMLRVKLEQVPLDDDQISEDSIALTIDQNPKPTRTKIQLIASDLNTTAEYESEAKMGETETGIYENEGDIVQSEAGIGESEADIDDEDKKPVGDTAFEATINERGDSHTAKTDQTVVSIGKRRRKQNKQPPMSGRERARRYRERKRQNQEELLEFRSKQVEKNRKWDEKKKEEIKQLPESTQLELLRRTREKTRQRVANYRKRKKEEKLKLDQCSPEKPNKPKNEETFKLNQSMLDSNGKQNKRSPMTERERSRRYRERKKEAELKLNQDLLEKQKLQPVMLVPNLGLQESECDNQRFIKPESNSENT